MNPPSDSPLPNPKLGDDIHFIHYTNGLEGQERSARVAWVHSNVLVNLHIFCKDPAEDINPPGLVDFKFNVPYEPTGTINRTWHRKEDCPLGL